MKTVREKQKEYLKKEIPLTIEETLKRRGFEIDEIEDILVEVVLDIPFIFFYFDNSKKTYIKYSDFIDLDDFKNCLIFLNRYFKNLDKNASKIYKQCCENRLL